MKKKLHLEDKLSEFSSEEIKAVTQIVTAFEGDENALRSVGGIARETGVAFDMVSRYLSELSELFEKSSLTPSGSTDLYSPNQQGIARFERFVSENKKRPRGAGP